MKPKMLFLFNKISEKVAEIGPIKNKNNNNWLKRVQPNQMQANSKLEFKIRKLRKNRVN